MGRTPAFFAQLLRTNAAFNLALDSADAPTSLVRATLLYGPGVVAVKMPWVAGTEVTAADENDPQVLRPAAEAVVFLAKHALLHTDVRPANVIVDRAADGSVSKVVLVDYDDLVQLPAPATTVASLETAMVQHKVAWWGVWHSMKAAVSALIG
jgi:Ser/Thr protein kinase RdoA (MazF antagonist)